MKNEKCSYSLLRVPSRTPALASASDVILFFCEHQIYVSVSPGDDYCNI